MFVLHYTELVQVLVRILIGGIMYLNMTKAFDRVRHSVLLNKLWNVNILGSLHSYLFGRQLQDDLNNLGTWSASSGLNFNPLKTKCQLITRKRMPTIHQYSVNNKPFERGTRPQCTCHLFFIMVLTWGETRALLERN